MIVPVTQHSYLRFVYISNIAMIRLVLICHHTKLYRCWLCFPRCTFHTCYSFYFAPGICTSKSSSPISFLPSSLSRLVTPHLFFVFTTVSALLQMLYMKCGPSSHGAQAQLPHGMWALHIWIRDQTRVPCIRSWILNHWTTRGVPISLFLILSLRVLRLKLPILNLRCFWNFTVIYSWCHRWGWVVQAS